MDAGYRSGFVGIIGRPNVGKSTLLNYYLQQKVAIVSPRPQTTRHRILGVLTRDDAQVMFLDSPGFHKPEHALDRYMQGTAKTVVEEADVALILVDASRGITDEDERVFSYLRQAKRRAILALNKVDLIKKPRLLPLLEAGAKTNLFAECIPVSAATGAQMDVLLARLIALLPEGPRWYEPEHFTDQTTRQLIAEFIREQALLATRQEVPYAVAVLVDQIEDQPQLTVIQATLFVDRPGQKAILIGKSGSMLKRIGQEARRQIERLLGRKVYLGLWVKVVEGWRSNPRLLQELGYAGMGP